MISGDEWGIEDAGGGNDVFEGNLVGTDASGLDALGNAGYGIASDAPGDTIGGTAAGAGNVVSGNESIGLALGVQADNTLVAGNIIGTDITGSTRYPTWTASMLTVPAPRSVELSLARET